MAGNGFRRSALRRFRHRVGPWIDRLGNSLGGPTTLVYPEGYVGTVDVPIDDFEAALNDGGFTWDPVSMYHRTPNGSTTDGSWAYRSSPLGRRQLHVVLFAQRPDQIDVYAHDEFNWRRHPLRHARQVDIRREEGVAEMRRWLDDHGIAYRQAPFAVRKVKHRLERLSSSD